MFNDLTPVKKTRRHRWLSSIFLLGYSVTVKNDNRSFEMGKSMFNFGKQGKEKARQQRQMDKAAKRIMAKQQKANLKTGTQNADSNITEPGTVEKIG
jgi:hypothetical protein